MKNILKFVFGITILFVATTAGPFLFIWALNTLMVAGGILGFHIPFTFWTWLAALILGGLSIIPKLRRG